MGKEEGQTGASRPRDMDQLAEVIEEKNRFERVLSVLDEGINIVSRDYKILYQNPKHRKMVGAHVGEACFLAYQQRDSVCPGCPVARVFEDGRSHRAERELRTDGQVRYFDISAFPMLDEEGEATAGIKVVREVTGERETVNEKQRIERQIQYVQKLESLGVLAGGIAHDFNNLLMAILGNADLALLSMAPLSPARENINAIKKASQRAAELCKQMLAYSGKGKFLVQPIDLSELIREMSHMLEVSVSKKAVLKYNFADILPAIEADATQVRQVIMNLVTNASEAIGDKSGIISLATGAMECDRAYLANTFLDEYLPEGLYSYVEVADTGCGMNEEVRAKLFDPFFTTKFTGRGLGMSAVLGIVRGHRGGIKVYSEPGQGSTIKVLFPALEGVVPGHEPGSDVRSGDWPGQGMVLLVDDEETVRAVGKQMLEYLGFTVLTAEDGRQAVDLFRRRADEIDCVLLDLSMPHMNGEEAYRELRRIRPEVRVIISSGYNEPEVSQHFVGKGLAGFIQKPYQLTALKKIIFQVVKDGE